MVRAAYALGGLGSGLCENEQKLREVSKQVSYSVLFIDRYTLAKHTGIFIVLQ